MSMMDIMGMMGKVKEMQSKMQDAQEKLADIVASGEAGGGMVKVLVNGKKEILKIEIEPELVKPEEVRILQDLIVAAANKAFSEVEILAKNEISKVTEGILPKIPGFDLASLFNK